MEKGVDEKLASVKESQTWAILRLNETKDLHASWLYKQKSDAEVNAERLNAEWLPAGTN